MAKQKKRAKYNKGNIAEAIVGAALFAKFINRPKDKKTNYPALTLSMIEDNKIQKLLNLYMKQKKLTIRDLLNPDVISRAKSSIEKVISTNPLFQEKKSEMLQQLEKTMSSYREVNIKNNIKIAQRQNKEYKAEDINVIEQINGQFLDLHNLANVAEGTFTALQAQSVVNKIYKRDKNLIDNQLTFQSRHNDNDTLDIIVNIQDKIK